MFISVYIYISIQIRTCKACNEKRPLEEFRHTVMSKDGGIPRATIVTRKVRVVVGIILEIVVSTIIGW